MTNPTIETDIAEILKDLQKGQKDILISLETVKGDIKALDTKVEQLDKRIARAFPCALRRRGVARQPRISKPWNIYRFAVGFIKRTCQLFWLGAERIKLVLNLK